MKRHPRALLGVAFVVSSCAQPSKIDIAERYVSDVRELNLVPVYPPSDNYQIGDVYLVLKVSKAKTDRSPYGPKDSEEIRIGYMDVVRRQAERSLRERINLADTKFTSTGDLLVAQDDVPLGQLNPIGDKGSALPLPSVAFPSVSGDAGSTYGLAPLGGLFGLRLAGGARTTVTLDFKDVRLLSAPKIAVSKPIADAFATRPFSGECKSALNLIWDRFRDKIDGASGTTTAKPMIEMEYKVITQTYLTRQIDYSYTGSSVTALSNEIAAKGTQTAAYAPTVIIGTATDGAASALTTALSGVQAQKTSGFSGGTFDRRGITLQRKFQRPVAIAYEGLTYGICRETNGKTGLCETAQSIVEPIQYSPDALTTLASLCDKPTVTTPKNPPPKDKTISGQRARSPSNLSNQ